MIPVNSLHVERKSELIIKIYFRCFSDSADRRIRRVEEVGEEKYLDTVKSANKRIDRVLEEKREVEQRAKELDEECDELLEKLNVIYTN